MKIFSLEASGFTGCTAIRLFVDKVKEMTAVRWRPHESDGWEPPHMQLWWSWPCSRTKHISCLSPHLPLLCYCSLVHVKNKQSKYNHFWIKPSLRQLAGGVHASFSKMLEKILGTSLEMQSENISKKTLKEISIWALLSTKANAEQTKNGS